MFFFVLFRYNKKHLQTSKSKQQNTSLENAYENAPVSQNVDSKSLEDAVDDSPKDMTSDSEVISTFLDRSENRKNVELAIEGAYENVSEHFSEKSDKTHGADSLDDIDIKMEDDSKTGHYSPLTTYDNIPRNTNDNVLVNEYEMLKK